MHGPTVRTTTCALDCPDACSILVTIEDGKATRLRGNPEHPVTRGFLCAKVATYLDREYHPDRLLYPQRRVGAKGEGRFERIAWDEALDEIAARLKGTAAKYGGEAILPYSYAGTMGYIQSSSLDRRFFHRLGASRLDRNICSGAGVAGMQQVLGARYGTEPEQFAHSKLILAWGANILATNVHLWPFILDARRNGARFYTIDPVKTRTGSIADRHFFIHPGTDKALALGMMHVILAEKLEDREYLDRCTEGLDTLREKVRDYTPAHVEQLTGVAAADVVQLAREYATTRPAVIRANYGLQRSESGASTVSVVSMLPALTGSWRDVGGGIQLTTSGAFHLDRAALEMPWLQQESLGRDGRLLNMSTLGSVLNDLDPPVRAMVVYNANPAAVVPDQNRVKQGLRREDLFTVVLEQFLTDTARYADILLPATTFLEHDDLYFAYGHYYLQLARKAVEPPGECKSNIEVFRLLSARMGFDEPYLRASDDEMIRAALASGHRFLDGITLERLEREHSVRLNVSEPGTPFLPHRDGFPALPNGRMVFRGEWLDYTPPVESRHGAAPGPYPLEMVSPKLADGLNSTFGNRPEFEQKAAKLLMNTADAAPRGIADGDLVRMFNARGSVRMRAEVNGAVAPGVVSAPSSRWSEFSLDRGNANALISERLADGGGSPAFYNCLVEVERCGD